MYDDERFVSLGGFGGAAVVRALLLATAAVYVLQLVADRMTGGVFTALFGLSRAGLRQGGLWQPVSYLFLHGSLMHLLMNLLGLYVFGRELEETLGARRFCGLYFGGGALAGLGWLLISGRAGGPCIGASGAVFGVMGAFAALFPERRITLLLFFVLPVTMTARVLVIVLAAVAVLLLMGGGGNAAHAAHLVGGVAGYAYGRPWRRRGGWAGGGGSLGERLADWRARWRRRALKLVAPEELPPDPEEVDRILEKIKVQGLDRLTRRERRALERASRASAAERES